MKRILIVMVLATALVFAYSGVAMATIYAGWGVSPGAEHPGYMSWDDARALALEGGVTQTSPHGGYTRNTVKCAVCHSVHRAYSADPTGVERTTPGVGDHLHLTAGLSCVACHTPGGATPAATLVEWPSVYAEGGPHANQSCLGACHSSIHGGNLSQFAPANAFLLNPVLDAGVASGLAAGNVRAGVVDASTLTTSFDALIPGVQAANRAMVTGYLCAQSGCHVSSQFAVNTWGYGGSVAIPNEANNRIVTGHLTAFSPAQHCSSGGCHAVASDPSDSNCAMCHDMIGQATNRTAFPHANRNIGVLELVREPSVTTPTVSVLTTRSVIATAGNLWMYTGDVTFRDGAGVPTTTPMWDGMVGHSGASVLGFAPDRINTRTLLSGNVGTVGNLGNIQDGVCLKCHGFEYWPVHGMQIPTENEAYNFSRR